MVQGSPASPRHLVSGTLRDTVRSSGGEESGGEERRGNLDLDSTFFQEEKEQKQK